MIFKYLKKKHQDFKIKQATKKFEKRKNQYYNIREKSLLIVL